MKKTQGVNMMLCVSPILCVWGDCEKEQVYLTGQVAPLCLKPYLQQSGVCVCRTGIEIWGVSEDEREKEKLSV